MYITKQQSWVIAVGTLLLFFIVTFTALNNRQSATKTSTTSIKTEQSEPKPLSMINLGNFHRAETKNGQTVWEISAKEGVINPATGEINLDQVLLTLYGASSNLTKTTATTSKSPKVVQTTITSAKATVFIEGANLTRARIYGGVVIVHDERLTLKTPEATFDRAANFLKADGEVFIEEANVSTKAVGLEVNLTSQQVTLLNNVVSTIKVSNKVSPNAGKI